MPSTNDPSGLLPPNNGDDVIEEDLLFLESIGGMADQVRSAGITDLLALEQITYIMALMTIPADNDPAAYVGPDND